MRSEQDDFLELLYRKYYNQLKLYAISYLKDSHRADEVVQDSFHEAVKHIDKLMIHSEPEKWMKRTVKNKIRNSEKIRMRYVRRFICMDTELLSSIKDPYSFEEEAIEKEKAHSEPLMDQIKSTLTSEEFYLLKRITLEKATHLEVAEELGITIWTSQKRLERIRKKLNKSLPERKKK